jgi:PhnB protein
LQLRQFSGRLLTESEMQGMTVEIVPMLAVSHGDNAIEFYKSAFHAEILWRLGEGADLVAGLSIGGAKFFLAYEAPPYGTRGPSGLGFTTVRIELFVDDPLTVYRRALAAGAVEHSPISEDELQMSGPQPIKRMLQGAVVDPFGHIWLIGKILE